MKKQHVIKMLLIACTINGSFVLAEDTGKTDFLTLCSSCHGMDGKGKGPMHLTTETKPTNLTLLSQSHGGNFPYLQVRRVIDGRVEKGNTPSHFKCDMPAWGDVFVGTKGNSPDARMHGEVVAKMRILNIVDYLASIQEQCTGDCE
jgi:hypothetical protein